MPVRFKKLSNDDRGTESEAWDVNQKDERMIWLTPRIRGGCKPLATEAFGGLRERLTTRSGGLTADMMKLKINLLLLRHLHYQKCFILLSFKQKI